MKFRRRVFRSSLVVGHFNLTGNNDQARIRGRPCAPTGKDKQSHQEKQVRQQAGQWLHFPAGLEEFDCEDKGETKSYGQTMYRNIRDESDQQDDRHAAGFSVRPETSESKEERRKQYVAARDHRILEGKEVSEWQKHA